MGYKPEMYDQAIKSGKVYETVMSKDPPLDPSVDWRTKNGGLVTPIKNQGQCGSCWAFSSTGSVEGLTALRNGWNSTNLESYSEQCLVDCSSGSVGCNGGEMLYALIWMSNGNPLMLEKDYPYKARDGACAYDWNKASRNVQVHGGSYFEARQGGLK